MKAKDVDALHQAIQSVLTDDKIRVLEIEGVHVVVQPKVIKRVIKRRFSRVNPKWLHAPDSLESSEEID